MGLSLGISLFCGLPQPLHSLYYVLRDSLVFGIRDTEIVLSLGKSLLCGLAPPLHSLR
jgi:hypothetical protein